MRISDWSSDVCSSDLGRQHAVGDQEGAGTQVVGDDPVRDRMLAVGRLIGGFGRGFDDGAQQVGVVVVVLTLQHGGEALERSEEHTSELQSQMRITYAVYGLKTKKHINKEQFTTHLITKRTKIAH